MFVAISPAFDAFLPPTPSSALCPPGVFSFGGHDLRPPPFTADTLFPRRLVRVFYALVRGDPFPFFGLCPSPYFLHFRSRDKDPGLLVRSNSTRLFWGFRHLFGPGLVLFERASSKRGGPHAVFPQ